MKSIRRMLAGVLVLFLGAAAPPAAAQENLGTSQSQLSVARETIWNPIPVCWDTPGFSTEKQVVQQAVLSTWAQVSGVQFPGWGPCASNAGGVRITVSDSGPHTKGLGKKISGKAAGMVLNFTFKNWSTGCAGAQRLSCIRSIAVHEFGHAMGFAHEQNRPDRPDYCPQEQRQGSDGDWNYGAWDLSSVMNYCNPNWNNGGQLSATDIQGAQRSYGPPRPWESAFAQWCSHASARFYLGDFNGDGLSDFLCHDATNGRRWVSYATGDASAPVGESGPTNTYFGTNWCGHPSGQLHIGDFNGDGRQDLLCHDVASGYKWVSLSGPSGLRDGTSWESPLGKFCSHAAGRLFTGDFNGDRKTDLLCHDVQTGRKWIAFAKSNGTFSGIDWESELGKFCSHAAAQLLIGDFNGDGRSDLLCHDVQTGRKWIAYATPGGTFTGTNWEANMNWCRHPAARLMIADLNGDKRSDLLCHDVDTGWKWFAYARPGGTFTGTDWEGPYARWCSHPGAQFMLGNFNKDSKADLLCHDRATGRKWISFTAN